jgi:mono/diheme cytochrome c family protein
VTVFLVLALAATAVAAPPPEDVALYQRWCARCHGERGDGKGPASAALALNGAAPRDFTAGRFKLTSVGEGDAPADGDLARTIEKGIPGTSMPAFADLLSADEIARLVAVVRSFATTPRPAGTSLDLGPEPADDDESRRRGAARYGDLGCPACHGESAHGDGPSASQLQAADGSRIAPADLTRPWTFKGGSAARDVATRLAAGIGGTPMPGYLDAASKTDLWDVAHYVVSLARAPSLRRAAAAAAREEPDAGEPLAKRGAYVVQSGTCFLCHVQMNPDGSYVAGSFGAGGMRVEIAGAGRVFTRNLTPDPENGLGRWTADDLRRALRDGRTPTGRALAALDMPWTIFAGLTDHDVDAIHAYLASLPPVRNVVPPPEAATLADGVLTKLALFVRGGEIVGTYHPGNAGHEPRAGESSAPVENPGADAWIALACVGAIIAHRLARRHRRRERLVLAALAAGFVTVYTWPPLRWMPPALVRAAPPFETLGRAFGLPPLRPPPAPVDLADDDTAALARRGRYVATIGSCSLCHTAGPDPLRLWRSYPEMGGGMRVAWKVFGTTYSRNLTPDRETGLGDWSDGEIRRAVTSGIARGGRLMHWQAMPWDHFSRLSPEDLEALVVYLRHLPPVRSQVPAPVPPGASDPDGDTFAFGYTGTYLR